MKIFKKLLVLGALLAPIVANSFLVTSCYRHKNNIAYEQDLFAIMDQSTGLHKDELECNPEYPLMLTRILQDDLSQAVDIIKNVEDPYEMDGELNKLRHKKEAILDIEQYKKRVQICITEDEKATPNDWYVVMNEMEVGELAKLQVTETIMDGSKQVEIKLNFVNQTPGKKYYVYFKLDEKRAMGLDYMRMKEGDYTLKHQRAVFEFH